MTWSDADEQHATEFNDEYNEVMEQQGALAETCNELMPHFMNKKAPEGCPPNCPTRLAAEKEDKSWPPSRMETK